MTSGKIQSEIERAQRVGAALSSEQDRAALEAYVTDLLRHVGREPRARRKPR